MKVDPSVEKHVVKKKGKKDDICYSIYCNEEVIADISIEQLTDLHELIGQFVEEKKGGQG